MDKISVLHHLSSLRKFFKSLQTVKLLQTNTHTPAQTLN